MTTKNLVRVVAGFVLAVALVGSLNAFAAAGAGPGGAAGGAGERRPGERLAEWEKRITAHIEHLQARLAEHPNAPADLKAAVEKLIADLTKTKADIETAEAAVKARDRAAAKAAFETLKADHQTNRADREALCELLKKEHPGWRGHGGGRHPGGGAGA